MSVRRTGTSRRAPPALRPARHDSHFLKKPRLVWSYQTLTTLTFLTKNSPRCVLHVTARIFLNKNSSRTVTPDPPCAMHPAHASAPCTPHQLASIGRHQVHVYMLQPYVSCASDACCICCNTYTRILFLPKSAGETLTYIFNFLLF